MHACMHTYKQTTKHVACHAATHWPVHTICQICVNLTDSINTNRPNCIPTWSRFLYPCPIFPFQPFFNPHKLYLITSYHIFPCVALSSQECQLSCWQIAEPSSAAWNPNPSPLARAVGRRDPKVNFFWEIRAIFGRFPRFFGVPLRKFTRFLFWEIIALTFRKASKIGIYPPIPIYSKLFIIFFLHLVQTPQRHPVEHGFQLRVRLKYFS